MEIHLSRYIYFFKQLGGPVRCLFSSVQSCGPFASVTRWCMLRGSYHTDCLIWISNLIFWVEHHHCYWPFQTMLLTSRFSVHMKSSWKWSSPNRLASLRQGCCCHFEFKKSTWTAITLHFSVSDFFLSFLFFPNHLASSSANINIGFNIGFHKVCRNC